MLNIAKTVNSYIPQIVNKNRVSEVVFDYTTIYGNTHAIPQILWYSNSLSIMVILCLFLEYMCVFSYIKGDGFHKCVVISQKRQFSYHTNTR